MLSKKAQCQMLLLVFLILTVGGLISRAQVPLEVGRRDWAKALPDGEGKALVLATCTQCHSLTPIVLQRKPAKAWQLLVEDMIVRGAQIQVAEVNPITAYLIRSFGPDAAPVTMSGGSQATQPASVSQATVTSAQGLPEGAGKDVILRACTSCHALSKTTEARKDALGWRGNIKDMVSLGAIVTPEEENIVVVYLTKNFGRQETASPVAATGLEATRAPSGMYGMGRASTSPAHLLPDDEGKALILASCVQCHPTLSYVLGLRKTEAGWRHSVEDMVARGAQVTPAESEIIIRYLTKHMPPTKKTE